MTPAFARSPFPRYLLCLAGLVVAALAALQIRLEQPHYAHAFRVGEHLAKGSEAITLEALDLTPEPGEIMDDAEKQRFFSRQESLARILASDSIRVNNRVLMREDTLPLLQLPLAYWVQFAVGIGAFLISGWIFALKPRFRPALLFFASGIGTLLFTLSSAIYTTRDLALAERTFRFLTHVNEVGASAFGIATLVLLLHYPLRLRRARGLSLLASSVFGIWTMFAVLSWIPAAFGVNLITLCEMVGICLAVAMQFRATRYHADARAVLVYLGMAIILGAGFFIALNATPLVFGQGAAVGQEYGFLSFLLLYVGLAFGINRYKLFEVSRWSFRLLFYGLGTLLLLGLDWLLVQALHLEPSPAFVWSLLAVGFLYLPLRGHLSRLWTGEDKIQPDLLLDLALKSAFAATPKERMDNWRKALDQLFQALELEVLTEDRRDVAVEESGLSLALPSSQGFPAIRLRHRQGGRALFDRESQRLGRKLIDLLSKAQSQREAYDKGALEERQRMARDLHDDIGSRILSLVYASEGQSRPELQALLGDLRTLVNDLSREPSPICDLLSEMRFETTERLRRSNLRLVWEVAPSLADEQHPIDYHVQKALRSGLRELVSNTIKHAGAEELRVIIAEEDGRLTIDVQDDGCGRRTTAIGDGFGLKSLEQRLALAKGSLELPEREAGFAAVFTLPYKNSASSPRMGDDSYPLPN